MHLIVFIHGLVVVVFSDVQKRSRDWLWEDASHTTPMEVQIKRPCDLGAGSSEEIGDCVGCECCELVRQAAARVLRPGL